MGLLLLTREPSFLRINGPISSLEWGCLVLGLAVLYVFYRHENKQKDPLIDFTVFFPVPCGRCSSPPGCSGFRSLGPRSP